MLRLEHILDETFFKDRVHLNWDGNDKMAEEIFKSVRNIPQSWFSTVSSRTSQFVRQFSVS